MYFICYKSFANIGLQENQVINILHAAQKNNLKNGITGMLLFIENNFIQIIEGEKDAVENLFQKINNDKRHVGIKIVSQGFMNERFFPNWVMGFRILSKYDLEEMVALNGIGSFTIDELLEKANPHIVIEMLKSFYKNGELNYYKFWHGM